MTNQMDATQLRSFAATRAAERQMQKARPTVRPVPKPVPEAERHARAKVRAKAKAHQGVTGAAGDQMGDTSDITNTGALPDGTPITPAVQLNMLHQIVNAMGSLAGEEDPARRTSAQNLNASAERIAEVTRLTGDRLGELMASNPNMTDERLAELNRLFGIPDAYEPGHED